MAKIQLVALGCLALVTLGAAAAATVGRRGVRTKAEVERAAGVSEENRNFDSVDDKKTTARQLSDMDAYLQDPRELSSDVKSKQTTENQVNGSGGQNGDSAKGRQLGYGHYVYRPSAASGGYAKRPPFVRFHLPGPSATMYSAQPAYHRAHDNSVYHKQVSTSVYNTGPKPVAYTTHTKAHRPASHPTVVVPGYTKTESVYAVSPMVEVVQEEHEPFDIHYEHEADDLWAPEPSSGSEVHTAPIPMTVESITKAAALAEAKSRVSNEKKPFLKSYSGSELPISVEPELGYTDPKRKQHFIKKKRPKKGVLSLVDRKIEAAKDKLTALNAELSIADEILDKKLSLVEKQGKFANGNSKDNKLATGHNSGNNIKHNFAIGGGPALGKLFMKGQDEPKPNSRSDLRPDPKPDRKPTTTTNAPPTSTTPTTTTTSTSTTTIPSTTTTTTATTTKRPITTAKPTKEGGSKAGIGGIIGGVRDKAKGATKPIIEELHKATDGSRASPESEFEQSTESEPRSDVGEISEEAEDSENDGEASAATVDESSEDTGSPRVAQASKSGKSSGGSKKNKSGSGREQSPNESDAEPRSGLEDNANETVKTAKEEVTNVVKGTNDNVVDPTLKIVSGRLKALPKSGLEPETDQSTSGGEGEPRSGDEATSNEIKGPAKTVPKPVTKAENKTRGELPKSKSMPKPKPSSDNDKGKPRSDVGEISEEDEDSENDGEASASTMDESSEDSGSPRISFELESNGSNNDGSESNHDQSTGDNEGRPRSDAEDVSKDANDSTDAATDESPIESGSPRIAVDSESDRSSVGSKKNKSGQALSPGDSEGEPRLDVGAISEDAEEAAKKTIEPVTKAVNDSVKKVVDPALKEAGGGVSTLGASSKSGLEPERDQSTSGGKINSELKLNDDETEPRNDLTGGSTGADKVAKVAEPLREVGDKIGLDNEHSLNAEIKKQDKTSSDLKSDLAEDKDSPGAGSKASLKGDKSKLLPTVTVVKADKLGKEEVSHFDEKDLATRGSGKGGNKVAPEVAANKSSKLAGETAQAVANAALGVAVEDKSPNANQALEHVDVIRSPFSDAMGISTDGPRSSSDALGAGIKLKVGKPDDGGKDKVNARVDLLQEAPNGGSSQKLNLADKIGNTKVKTEGDVKDEQPNKLGVKVDENNKPKSGNPKVSLETSGEPIHTGTILKNTLAKDRELFGNKPEVKLQQEGPRPKNGANRRPPANGFDRWGKRLERMNKEMRDIWMN